MFTLAARLASLAFAAAAVVAAPAYAAPVEPTGSVMVRHADLDLGTVKGVTELNQRIRRAAAQVCGSFYPADLRARANALSCRAAAVAAVQGKVQLAVAGARQSMALNMAATPPAIAIP